MKKSHPELKKNIVAVDLFCGVGGLTHGLVLGGINVTAGVDLDPACKYPFEANNAAKFIEHDVGTLDAKEVKQLLSVGDYSLLAGCAPCQPFSTYSRSGRNKEYESQWPLVLAFGQLIKKVKPDLVTMENVPQLADHEVFQDFIKGLRGYKVWWSVLDCVALGVPQTRKRLVLLASRLGDKHLSIETEPNYQALTVRETIKDLPKLKAGEQSRIDPLHAAPALSELNLKRIKASKPGGTWRDWPSALQADCHQKASGATYPSVYGRMEWDKPSPTITTQCFGYGNGRFGHPEQHRAVSLREAAMLQTFPATYKFVPPGERVRFNKLGRLIGNAVPVRLGQVIAETLAKHIQAYSKAPAKSS